MRQWRGDASEQGLPHHEEGQEANHAGKLRYKSLREYRRPGLCPAIHQGLTKGKSWQNGCNDKGRSQSYSFSVRSPVHL